MSKYSVPFTDLQTPLTEKSRAKLIGHINMADSLQTTAATLAGDHCWMATFDGRLGDAYVVLDADPSGAETMEYDLQKNGTTVLTGTLTLDNTASHEQQHSLKALFDDAEISFVTGDVFTVDRTYTAGGGAVEVNKLVIEPSLAPYDA